MTKCEGNQRSVNDKRNCGRCHTCGTELQTVQRKDWCPTCQCFRLYRSHGWAKGLPEVSDSPCEDAPQLTIREKFDSKTPAEKAAFFRSLRALIAEASEDDEISAAETAATDDLLEDLDRFARHYEREAELEDRRRFWNMTLEEGP